MLNGIIPDKIIVSDFSFFIATAMGFFARSLMRKYIHSLWLHAIFNLIGTIFHETAHALVGMITFGGVSNYSILPKKVGNQWILGSVQLTKLNGFNAFPIAMAPLLLFLTPFFLGKIYDGKLIDTEMAVFLWTVTGIICQSAIPSVQDFKIAFTYWLGTFGWIIAITYYFFPTITTTVIDKIVS